MIRAVISNRNMLAAMLCAVVLHLVLIAIQVSFEPPERRTSQTISVRLQAKEPPTIAESLVQEERPEDKEQEVSEQTPEVEDDVIKERLIVAKPSENQSKQTEDKVQININSTEFREFLRNETDLYRESNPESVSKFGTTFEPAPNTTTVVSSTSDEALAQIEQNGVGMSQDKNGNRTCYAQIPDLLVDTPRVQTTLSKDCTPPKKFILDLNKPRNN